MKASGNLLKPSFFKRDVLIVAPQLLGKTLVRMFENGEIKRFTITELEAYKGEDDLACHASKGRTQRNEVMYWEGGYIYVYLIYGIHYLLNFVTGNVNQPQALLIRGINNIVGPGRVSKALSIDKSLNHQNLFTNKSLWIEDNNLVADFTTDVRVGVDYAGEIWKNKPWRFIIKQ